MKKLTERPREWLNNLPISDPVESRMAALLQVILIGFIIILIAAIFLTLVIGSSLSPQQRLTSLITNFIGILVFTLPLVILRLGYFRSSVLTFIGILLLLSVFSVVLAMGLQGANGTIFPLTLAMILAGLLVDRKTLLLIFGLSIGVLIFGARLEQSASSQIKLDNTALMINFSLYNGLMGLFLDRFGVTLRDALTTAHTRASSLQTEIRERKLAEEKYRNIFENAIDGIFQSTPAGRFIRVNPAMARMYGYDSAEEMVQSITDISTQVYVNINERTELRRRLANDEKLTGFETLDYRKDKSTFWTSMNVQAIHDAGGNVLYYEGTIEDITSRKAAVENLKERQHLIETILDAEPGTVYIYDLQVGKNVFVNQNWLINYGYSVEETQDVENLLSEVIHPDDLAQVTAYHDQIRTVKDDIDIFEIEYRIHRKDGEWRWVQSRDTIFSRSADGQVTQILGILHDITESKKSRSALIESEKKYRQLFENMTSGFAVHKMIYDENGKPVDYLYLEINPAFEKLTGVPVNVLLGKTIKEIMPNTEEYWIEKFGEVASTGQPIAYTNFSRELGKYYDTYAFSPEMGTFAVVFNDVTEKIRAQEEVLKSQRRLQAFFNQSLDGFFFLMFDEPLLWNDAIDKEQALLQIFNNQHYTDVNNSMLEQYNITREEFLQRTSRDFFAHDLEQGLHLRRELFNIGHLHRETFERKTDGSPVWFEGDYACLYDDQKRITGFFGIQRDVTERKKSEVEIQKLNQELNERVQELEAKNAELTQFTYTVSHDLKSPLVTINGYLGYLEQDAASGNMERLRKDIQRIHDAASKMHALLTELLGLSRIGRMMNAPENIPFDGLVKEALDIVHGQLEKHQVTVHSQPNLPAVHGDRQRLIEVLQNLLDNAAKYMGERSDPHIEIGQRGEDNGKPIFFVKDNGIGIAPNLRAPASDLPS